MKIEMDGSTYTAETATGLIGQLKHQHWQMPEDGTAEDYIAVQGKFYKKVTGRKFNLPDADTETRARAMFREIAKLGAWDFTEDA